jgi:hypothetical protein
MPLLIVPNYLQGSALSNTGLMSYLPNYLQGYALLKKNPVDKFVALCKAVITTNSTGVDELFAHSSLSKTGFA